MIIRTFTTIAFLMLVLFAPLFGADTWSAPVHVNKGLESAVRYRAQVRSGYLLVEAEHGKGWHSYAMDNRQRAKAKGGDDAESELPTEIVLIRGAEVDGPWLQTAPKDLSDPSIFWYTWGFEGKAIFAAKLSSLSEEGVEITIRAQVCNASSCAMADDVTLKVVPNDSANEEDKAIDELIQSLVAVDTSAQKGATE